MKKTFLLPALCLLVPLVLMVSAVAAGGDLSDPLASLSYLTGIFTDTVDERVEEKLDASDEALLSGDLEPASGSFAAVWATSARSVCNTSPFSSRYRAKQPKP